MSAALMADLMAAELADMTADWTVETKEIL